MVRTGGTQKSRTCSARLLLVIHVAISHATPDAKLQFSLSGHVTIIHTPEIRNV